MISIYDRVISSFILVTLVSYKALKKNSLDTSGAIMAWFIGFLTGINFTNFFFIEIRNLWI